MNTSRDRLEYACTLLNFETLNFSFSIETYILSLYIRVIVMTSTSIMPFIYDVLISIEQNIPSIFPSNLEANATEKFHFH